MGNPQVTPITERRHAWGFMVWEPSDGMISRGQIVLAQGFGIYSAGAVLGLQSVGAASIAALGTNVGNPTFSAITVAAPAVAGLYNLVMLNATEFEVVGPSGQEIGHGVFGAPFTAGGLVFTGSAGATACAPGDSYTLTVAFGAGQYAWYDPTKSDGTEVAVAILGSEYKDTTLLTQKGAALIRGPARVNQSELIYGPNVTTTPQITAALAALQILGIQNT